MLVELEDYTIEQLIGKGAFGVVFRAKENKSGKDVALKVVTQTEALKSTKDQLDIFRNISVPRLLNLPGMVKFLGFRSALTKEELFKKDPKSLKDQTIDRGKKVEFDLSGELIVTEFMKNGSLDLLVSEYLKTDGKVRDKLNPTVRSKIIFGVAATMKRVHKSNIIHRDLKVENVFLDDNLEPRIADFELAKVMMGKIDMTMPVGTPYILAPEIFMDDESYGASVDVYSFAFLIYKMFTNNIQFADKKPIRSSQQYMMKIGRGNRPKRPDLIPDAYWELVQRCWKQNPEDRPTFDEITEELKNDKYAIEEFGMKTDLNQLHEYQKRIDKDEKGMIYYISSNLIEFNYKTYKILTFS